MSMQYKIVPPTHIYKNTKKGGIIEINDEMKKRKERRIQIEVWEWFYYKGKKTNYQVSTTGRVLNAITGKVKKPFISDHGYYRYKLYIDKKGKNMSAHRLAALTHIAVLPIPEKYTKLGLSENDLTINHRDGNKLNNCLYNLEWATIRDNTLDAVLTGLCDSYIGEKSHLAKMDTKTAIKCCKMLQDGKSFDDIAKALHITKRMVVHIKARECWKQVSEHFTFPVNNNPNSIPTEKIHNICKLIEAGKYTDKEIAEKVNLGREYVRDIRLHKRQNKISCFYHF